MREQFGLVIMVGYFVAAVINLAPVIGFVSDGQLLRLYGIEIEDAGLSLLLRHRALLFGIVGALLLVAVLRPELRVAAAVAGLVSMMSFVFLYFSIGLRDDTLLRIVKVDLVGSAVLAASLVLHFYSSRG